MMNTERTVALSAAVRGPPYVIGLQEPGTYWFRVTFPADEFSFQELVIPPTATSVIELDLPS